LGSLRSTTELLPLRCLQDTPELAGSAHLVSPLKRFDIALIIFAILCSLCLGAQTSSPASAATATANTIDLRPFGFKPSSNDQLLAVDYTSTVAFLADGSLLVGFRSGALIHRDKTLAHQRSRSDVQAIKLLHFDRSGKLIKTSLIPTVKNAPFLWPTANGGFLVRGTDSLDLYDADLVLKRSGRLPADPAEVAVPPPGDRAVVTFRGRDLDLVKVVDSAALTLERTLELPPHAPQAFLAGGYALLLHDANDKPLLEIDAAKRVNVPLAPMECFPRLRSISSDAVALAYCDHLQAFNSDGRRIFDHHLSADQGALRIFSAARAPVFGFATITGMSGADAVEQRIFGDAFMVYVADLTAGRILFKQKVSPLPRVGGAFALSPDGQTLAILRDGALDLLPIAASFRSPSGHAPALLPH